ncbi:MAG: hypothetical protein ACFE9R_16915, partial [Candidatus Hermodarchaeota archaeon]
QEHLELVKEKITSISFITLWKEIDKNGKKSLLISFYGGLKNLISIIQQGFTGTIDNVEDLKFRQNSLEDVFLNLTGRRLRD